MTARYRRSFAVNPKLPKIKVRIVTNVDGATGSSDEINQVFAVGIKETVRKALLRKAHKVSDTDLSGELSDSCGGSP